MGIGWPQLLVIAVIVLVLFGRGRISEMMGDFGKGINSFKKGLNEESSSSTTDSNPQIQAPASPEAPAATTETSETANTGDKSAS